MKKLLILILTLMLSVTMFGCGKAKEVNLTETYAQMTAGIDIPEMTTVSTEDALMSYYGINSADVKQCVAYICSTGIDADEIVLIEAVDENAADRIKISLDNRYSSQLARYKDYLPDQAAVIEACEVTQKGNYVSMIISPDAEAMVKIYDAQF